MNIQGLMFINLKNIKIFMSDSIEEQLIIGNDEKTSNLKNQISSANLSDGVTHRIEFLEGAGVGIFDNSIHEQDAFSVSKDATCVSDGASTYGKSGVISRMLSKGFVSEVQSGTDIGEIFDDQNVKKVIDSIKDSDDFKNFDGSQNKHAKGDFIEAGLATVLLTQIDYDKKKIYWGSVGDSPLLVFDKQPDGSWDFEILNKIVDDHIVTNKNFSAKAVRENLLDQSSPLIGVDEVGQTNISCLPSLQTGVIEYKPGRVVMLASDFITKMMVMAPEALEETAKCEEGFDEKHVTSLRSRRQTILEANNPFAGEKFKPELFFDGTLTPDQLKDAIDGWKEIGPNKKYQDDVTMIAIKMDDLFGKKSED